eukprot:8875568-Pyramimonas_sp.AAC.1
MGGHRGQRDVLAQQARRRVRAHDARQMVLAREFDQAPACDPGRVLYVSPPARRRRVWLQWAWPMVGLLGLYHAGRLPRGRAREGQAEGRRV